MEQVGGTEQPGAEKAKSLIEGMTEREWLTSNSNFIRLRGVPFSAKEDDVRVFLKGLVVKSVTFTLTPGGRATGECYVELKDKAAAEEAKQFHTKRINKRYIEVFNVTEGQATWLIRNNVIRRGGQDTPYNYVVRLRGIPYDANDDDFKKFFSGLEVADIVIAKALGGRPSGEAFVRFANKQHFEMALERNKNNMGTRYVKVFRSAGDEMEKSRKVRAAVPVSLRNCTFDWSFLASLERVPLRYAAAKSGRRSQRSDDSGGPLRSVSMNRSRAGPYDAPYSRFPDYSYEDDCVNYVPKVVFMWGLPYRSNALDIEEFFKPLNCIEIRLCFSEFGLPTGAAFVTFGTEAEALDALSRNRMCIGSRYIELSLTGPYWDRNFSELVGGTGAYPGRARSGGGDTTTEVSRGPLALNRVGYATSDSSEAVSAEWPVPVEMYGSYGTAYSCAAGWDGNYTTSVEPYYKEEHEGNQVSYSYQGGSSADAGSMKPA